MSTQHPLAPKTTNLDTNHHKADVSCFFVPFIALFNFKHISNIAMKVQWNVVAVYSFKLLMPCSTVQYHTLSNTSIANKSYKMLFQHHVKKICPQLPINFPVANREAMSYGKQ
jgi:hypothetical protein